jgi:hypothetical protein
MNRQDAPYAPPALNPTASSRALLRMLVIAAILLAAGLASFPSERDAPRPSVGDSAVAPIAPSPDVRAVETSVPPASEVFTGRGVAAEPEAPTF